MLKSPVSTYATTVRSRQTLFNALSEPPSPIPQNVKYVASIFLAVNYIKHGYDEMAVETLQNIAPLTSSSDVMLLGGCYSRLRRYPQALELYQTNASNSFRCRYSELLTCLKIGDLKRFEDSYAEYSGDNVDGAIIDGAIMNLEANTFTALASLNPNSNNIQLDGQSKILLESLRANKRTVPTSPTTSTQELLLRLASINALPVYNEFFQICENQFDDKRGFVELVKGEEFSPLSAIIRQTTDKIDESSIEYTTKTIRSWVVKRPFSWGGWGVEFFNEMCFEEMMEEIKKKTPRRCDLVVQELIDVATINDRACSLRLYVIFRDGCVFWSKDCLMKIASAESSKITNSAFNIAGGGGDQVEGWEVICNLLGGCEIAERQVAEIVAGVVASVDNKILPTVVPKILGFDLLIEKKSLQLKLIEINSTPGLVARKQGGGTEYNVKRRVLEEAWGIRKDNCNNSFVRVDVN
ncbi:hypothetical protein TrLO_g7112 [Triparma laevis f. longispina]|nr:hypothetical protein TrLO_g7112 [Triparma laevis f. longispina]